MDVRAIVNFIGARVREHAKDAGEACGMQGCDSLTLGVRCDRCYRRLCNHHVAWKIELAASLKPVSMKAYCPMCLFHGWSDTFSDVDVAAAQSDSE